LLRTPSKLVNQASRQLIKQRLGFLQDRRVETFGEPPVDGRKKVPGFDLFALATSQAGETGGPAQFEQFCALSTCNSDCLMKTFLRRNSLTESDE
jgi:hypothetical protein